MARKIEEYTDAELAQIAGVDLPKEPEKDLSELSDEELIKTANYKPLNEKRVIQASPLSFLEREHLSYATDQGRREYLEERFDHVDKMSNGKFAVFQDKDWYAIDPNVKAQFKKGGLKETFGDLADISDEIIRDISMGVGSAIGGLKGAGIGAVAGGGPTGAAAGAITGRIAGAGAGRGIGQELVRLRGQRAGLRPDETIGLALRRTGIESALGGIGEAAVPLVRGGQAALKRFATERLYRKNFKQALQNVWQFTAGIPRWAGQEIQEKTAKVVNNKSIRNFKGFVQPLLNKAKDGFDEMYMIANNQWKKTAGKDINKIIPESDAVDLFNNVLIKEQVLTPSGTVMGGLSKAETKAKKKILEYFRDTVSEFLPDEKGNITLGRLKDFIKTLDNDFIKWEKRGKAGNYERNIFKSVRRTIRDFLHSQSPKIEAADKKYGNIMTILDDVSAQGKTNLKKVEMFLRKFPDGITEVEKNAMFEIEKALSPKKKFMTDLFSWVTARAWNEGTKAGGFKGIRARSLGTVFGLAGVGGVTAGPAGAAAGIIGGTVLSTPRLLSRAIQGSQVVGKGVSIAAGEVGKKVAPLIAPIIAGVTKKGLEKAEEEGLLEPGIAEAAMISQPNKEMFAAVETSGDITGDYVQFEKSTFEELQERGLIDKSLKWKDRKSLPRDVYDDIAGTYLEYIKDTFKIPTDEEAIIWSWRPGWYKKYKGNVENIPDSVKVNIKGNKVKAKTVMRNRLKNLNEYKANRR